LKLRDGIKDTKTDAIQELLQLKHIVRKENQHRVIAGISSPPTSESTRPANGTHPAAVAFPMEP
jgi:hypothetical protein